jgi:hypothetical protein
MDLAGNMDRHVGGGTWGFCVAVAGIPRISCPGLAIQKVSHFHRSELLAFNGVVGNDGGNGIVNDQVLVG